MKAELIKDGLKDFTGHAALYKLSPPLKDENYEGVETEHEYVIVSSAYALGAPETYIFPSNSKGEVLDWGELDGSYKGGISHAKALGMAGYSL